MNIIQFIQLILKITQSTCIYTKYLENDIHIYSNKNLSNRTSCMVDYMHDLELHLMRKVAVSTHGLYDIYRMVTIKLTSFVARKKVEN